MRFCFLLLSWIFTLSAQKLKVEVKASSAILMNAETGVTLFEKRPFAPLFPASTTKIATALYILAEKKPQFDQKMKVSAESLRLKPLNKQEQHPPHWWYRDGTNMGLQAGELVSIDALLHGLMMVSGNDAANVLAEGFSEANESFVEELNQYVKKIGCTSTHFLNAHGCHHPHHTTTAYDLCLITKTALQIPKFRELVSTLDYIKPKTNKQGPVELKLINPLLKPGRFFYPKAIGVKSGFHLEAQYNLVAAAVHEGRTLIATIMGTQNTADRYIDAIALFEAAFAETKVRKRFFGPENIFSRKIPGTTRDLNASLSTEMWISYFPAEETQCRGFVFWESPLLPIRKGQFVGEVRIVSEQGNVLARGDLVAREDVKRTIWYILQNAISQFF
ncbi:MAG TPA: D-alanyl-D-alanine carboxypeptidase family protein [Chlamydiales bacterium]|nr:D-alanyl-D-alanine carboxypeptidase family protein [Chlamydiales bacterium]